jgi:hypothetical protein
MDTPNPPHSPDFQKKELAYFSAFVKTSADKSNPWKTSDRIFQALEKCGRGQRPRLQTPLCSRPR